MEDYWQEVEVLNSKDDPRELFFAVGIAVEAPSLIDSGFPPRNLPYSHSTEVTALLAYLLLIGTNSAGQNWQLRKD